MPTSPREPILVIGPSIAYLPLTRSYVALIDVDDAGVVSGRSWSAVVLKGGHVYGCAYVDGKFTYLHRFLCKPAAEKSVDHRNRNTMDHRRCNLREATKVENGRNMRGRSRTGRKGVSRCSRSGKYVVRLWDGKRNHYIGAFAQPEAASEAYSAAAKKHYGEFASC